MGLNKIRNEIPNILIVDDVIANVIILSEMMNKAGYNARPVTSVRQAMSAINVQTPNLILLDITMPEMDGFEFCQILKKDIRTREVPVIFISALDSTEDKIRCFKLGAVDYISKPFEIEEVTQRVNTHLKIYQMQRQLEIYNKNLYKIVNEQVYKILIEQKNIVYAITRLAEYKEAPNGHHLENVAQNCRLLAMCMQFNPRFELEINNAFIDTIELVAPFHDIGKIAISDQILLKKGPLTQEEIEIVKTHSEIGANTLQEILQNNMYSDFFKMAVDIAYYHHEKWNGTGYPKGLSGTQIPLCARIMAVVDTYDILLSEKCYKKAYTQEETVQIICEEAGKSFDPEIIEVFKKVYTQFVHN